MYALPRRVVRDHKLSTTHVKFWGGLLIFVKIREAVLRRPAQGRNSCKGLLSFVNFKAIYTARALNREVDLKQDAVAAERDRHGWRSTSKPDDRCSTPHNQSRDDRAARSNSSLVVIDSGSRILRLVACVGSSGCRASPDGARIWSVHIHTNMFSH